jgi:hypothetical protein
MFIIPSIGRVPDANSNRRSTLPKFTVCLLSDDVNPYKLGLSAYPGQAGWMERVVPWAATG